MRTGNWELGDGNWKKGSEDLGAESQDGDGALQKSGAARNIVLTKC